MPRNIIDEIKIGSRWELRNKRDASSYSYIGFMIVKPYESLKVISVTVMEDDSFIQVMNSEGFIKQFKYKNFIETFEEIQYQGAKLKDYVDEKSLFRDILASHHIDLYKFYNDSTRTIQINDVTFKVVFSVLEKTKVIYPVESKKERDYETYGRPQEVKAYEL